MGTISRMTMTGVLIAAVCIGSATAQELKVGDLEINQPWSRATPGGAKVGAGYLTITNKGSAPDRFIGGSTPAAGKLEIHEMTMKDGVMTMRRINDGLAIEPGKTVTFAPGGYHIMFVDLKAPLKQGAKLAATLEFEKAGKFDVTFDVQAVGAKSPVPAHSDHRM
jgi:periplasmic copper chaperone A